ncbi:MAG: HAD-IA family hydrolase [Clostridiales bacterium]|jgi:phosphoglycolate phosphatase|nr:HAD-IA family hydrolase [Clostridiales bacterium]
MTPRFSNILFDFDGTLCNSEEGILKCVGHALAAMGEPPLPRERMRRFIGPALYLSFLNEAGLTPERADEAVKIYRSRYIPVGIYECELYAGIYGLLDRLKRAGARLCIASAKPQQSVERAAAHLGIDGFFERIVGAPPDVKQNEKDAYLRAARLSGDAVMVGDAPFDIRAAKATGMASAAVTYGFFSPDELKALGPDFMADSPAELEKILLA